MQLKRAGVQFAFTAINAFCNASLMVAGTVGITLNDGLPESCVIKGGAVQRKLNGFIIDGNGLTVD